MHRQTVGVFGHVSGLVDVADVEFGVDPLREEIERQVHDVHVARALPVAEKRALDAVGAREDAEFGGGDPGAPVVVRVQREHDAVATVHVTKEPLDRVGVEIRRVHLDRRREVQDQRPIGRRIDDLDHRVADLERVVELGAGEALGRVLVVELGRRRHRLEGQTECGRVGRDLLDTGLVESEDDPSLQGRDRVVEVNDGAARPDDRFVRAADEVLAALGEDLDRDILRDQVVFDDVTNEVEVGLRGRRESDLDLLETHLDELDEHRVLAIEVHRIDQRLIAVAQVDAAPARGPGQSAVGPGAIRQVNWNRRYVFGVGHGAGLLVVLHLVDPFHRVTYEKQKTPATAGGVGASGCSPLSEQQVLLVLIGTHEFILPSTSEMSRETHR